ncbi:MAG: tetratricopeptide repeat protein [Bacteroidia bacterium]
MSNHHHKSPCLSSQEMLDYTQGILSTHEQHLFEKHLLECEFCSDALEGIQLMNNPNSLLTIEEELNLEIDSITAEEDDEDIEVKVLFPWRMAAAIALIFISTFTLWVVIPKNNMQELVSEKSVAYPAPAENSSAPPQEFQEMQVANEQSAPQSKSQTPTVLEREVPINDAVVESPDEKMVVTDEAFSSLSKAKSKEESNAATGVTDNEVATAPQVNQTSDNMMSGTILNEKSAERKKAEGRLTTSTAQKQNAEAHDDSDKFNSDDLYKKGITEYKNKKYSAAIYYLEQCTDKPEALFYSGVSYFLMDNPHLALSTLVEYIRTNESPYREASFWYLGLSHLQLNNKSAAKQSFEKVLPFKGEFEKQAIEMLKSL